MLNSKVLCSTSTVACCAKQDYGTARLAICPRRAQSLRWY